MAKADVLHFREHRITDWVSRTTAKGMGLLAKAIFSALLDAQWLEGSLPDNRDALRRIAQAERDEWAQFEPFLDGCFPVCEDGLRRCSWLNDERESVIKSRAAKSAGGTKAMAKRWRDLNLDDKIVITELSENAYLNDNLPITTRVSSHQSPITNQDNPPNPLGGTGGEEPPEDGGHGTWSLKQFTQSSFETFRSNYPKRSGGYSWSKAFSAFQALFRDRSQSSSERLFASIIEGLNRYVRYLTDAGKVGTQYVKQPASWIHAKGWEDEYELPKRSVVGTQIGGVTYS